MEVGGCIDPRFLDLSIGWKVSGQLYAPAALPMGVKAFPIAVV
jgi:hypothetical protein